MSKLYALVGDVSFSTVFDDVDKQSHWVVLSHGGRTAAGMVCGGDPLTVQGTTAT